MAKKAKKKRTRIEVEESSGNVFADLGLPNPDQELLKAGLTVEIYRILKTRRLTQAESGRILGIPQPHVSDLLRGRARAFSAERLMEFLAALGHDVEIRVKPTRKTHGVSRPSRLTAACRFDERRAICGVAYSARAAWWRDAMYRASWALLVHEAKEEVVRLLGPATLLSPTWRSRSPASRPLPWLLKARPRMDSMAGEWIFLDERGVACDYA